MADDFSQFPEAQQSSAASGEFADFPEANPASNSVPLAPGSDQLGAALEAGGRSALETSGFMAGAALGVKAGMVGGPAGAFVGGLAGGVGGYLAGDLAATGLGLRAPEQMPEGERPGGYFGQSLGGSATFGAAPFAMARTGLRFTESMVGRYLNQIIETAKARPLLTALSEGSAAVSAAGAAGLAEVVVPGETGVRIGSEVAGGLLNPTRLAISAAGYAQNLTSRAMQMVSPAARETAAARALNELLLVTGEDPTLIAAILRRPGVLPASELTAAQKTGSVALAALSDYLGKQNQRYGNEAGQKARDALDSIRGQITLLTGTGDPAAMAAAAQLRGVYYRTLIQTRVDGAQAEALTKSGRITRDTPAAREALSAQARTALEKAIADSRAAEKALWEQVDGTRPVQVSNLEQTYNEIVGDLLPEVRNEKVPTIVRNFLERVSKPGSAEFSYDPATLTVAPLESTPAGTNVNEMKQLRSELLDLARASDRSGEYGQARIYNQLAEAVLDDMDTAFRQAGDTAYDAARTFTRELNDTFTRSFAGKVMGVGKYGDRVAPELLLRKALAGGKESAALQMQELEEATRFMIDRGLGDDTAVRDMLDAQERMIRLAAADAINPINGRADPAKIIQFVKNNPTLMNRFPEVKADLQAATKSEEKLRALENRATGVDAVIAKQRDFGNLMGSYSLNPAAAADAARKAANRVVMSSDMESELARLVNIAKSVDPTQVKQENLVKSSKVLAGRVNVTTVQAIDGLRTSLFNAVIDNSTQAGRLNIDLVRQFLFNPTSVGKKPLIQVMKEQGLVTPAQEKSISQLFDAASAVQRSTRPGTAVNVETDVMDMLLSTVSRMVGSGAAGAAARGAGSATPSLIVHGAGARMAENIMTKVPVTTRNKVLVEAMNDPEKMAMLLEKADTPEKAAFKARQIHAWLVQSGFTGVTDEIDRRAREPQQPRYQPSRLLAPANQ